MPFQFLRNLFPAAKPQEASRDPYWDNVEQVIPTVPILTDTERVIVAAVQRALAKTDEEYSDEEVYTFLTVPMKDEKTLLDVIQTKFSDNLDAITTKRLVKVVGRALFDSLDLEDKLEYILEMAGDSLDLPEQMQEEERPFGYCYDEEEYEDEEYEL